MRWSQNLYSFTLLASSTLLILALLASQPPQTEASIRLCGQRLVSALNAICRNQLCGGMSAYKRSPYEMQPRYSTYSPLVNDLFHTHHQSKRGGIATECCENRCTMTYLKTYCCTEDDF